jgi:hypothetical protein
MTTDNWLTIVGIIAVIVIGVGGWYFLRPTASRSQNQKISDKSTGIQSGRDTHIRDE